MAVLLVISLSFNAYLIYRVRLKSSGTEANSAKNNKDSSKDIYENPHEDNVDSYEQVENEQSMYTALKRPGKDEDDHVNSHLNERPQHYENRQETGL